MPKWFVKNGLDRYVVLNRVARSVIGRQDLQLGLGGGPRESQRQPQLWSCASEQPPCQYWKYVGAIRLRE
jgi:hypothetical protein